MLNVYFLGASFLTSSEFCNEYKIAQFHVIFEIQWLFRTNESSKIICRKKSYSSLTVQNVSSDTVAILEYLHEINFYHGLGPMEI